MCGIVGILNSWPKDRIRPCLSKMMSSLGHRGPDEKGQWSQNGFGFAMCRLSVIDLENGRQPMWDAPTGMGLIYNGEVFNFLELRKRLVATGEKFETRSDTEVVLKGLAHQGLSAVEDWNGMFGLAAWLPASRRLTLIRDRLGIKPLYYYWDGRNFLFASEIKALLASGIVKPRLNHQAIWDYLTFRYVPGPQTIWQNVYKLPPGHHLTVSEDSEPRLQSYWDNSEPKFGPAENPIQEFKELWLDVVKIHLESADVPVGFLLSGGLDSSCLLATAHELGHRNLHSFSVGFNDKWRMSELDWAKRVAEHFQTEHHEIVMDRTDFLDLLPLCIKATDEPLADLTMVPLHKLCNLARQEVKVVLGGEGADEVLGGYTFEHDVRSWQRAASLQRLPSKLLKALAFCGKPFLSSSRHQFLQRTASTPMREWNLINLPNETRYFKEEEKQRLWPAFQGRDSLDTLRRQYQTLNYQTPLAQMLAVYQGDWLVEDLLMKSDKMSMANSLELRVPFLDFRLVEWANSQLDAVRVDTSATDGTATKNILRKFASSLLPPDILQRPKRGFPIPCYRWLTEVQTRDWARGRLNGPESRVGRALATEHIDELLNSAYHNQGLASHKIWALLVLDFWLEAWDIELC